MSQRLVSLTFLCTLMVSAGCGPGSTDADAGGFDAPGGGDVGETGCVGMADGTACGSGFICVSESCGASECGDGYLDTDAGEACDDGNTTAFDGCEPVTCTFTCNAATECDDGLLCNGAETCTDHVCALGPPADEGTACTRDAGGDGVCRVGSCVPAGCGNGVTDGTEDCDDMNMVDGDGCDGDCTFSCNEDVDCSDGNVCNGSETCIVATHACAAGTSLDCADTSACTMDSCDPIEGCQNLLIDVDGDGHASSELGACGDDCNDMRPDVFPGAEELCDGLDNNCINGIDEIAPSWYVDCDDDGFAASTDGARMGCTEPPAAATGCGGGWTAVRPVSTGTTDCNDNNLNVFPGQPLYFTTPIPGAPAATRYDYDCSGGHSRQYGCGPSSGGCGPSCTSGYTPRTTTNTNGCTFLCIGGGCFVSDYPDCGESASYLSCPRTSCTIVRSSARVQACH